MKELSIWLLLLLILTHLTPQFGEINSSITFGVTITSLIIMIIGILLKNKSR